MQTRKLIGDKTLIGYGAGIAALQTLHTTSMKMAYIADDRPELHGQQIAGIPIKSSAELAKFDPERNLVVVFGYGPRSIMPIQSKLEALGLRHERHWIDCSMLHYDSIGKRLREVFGIEPDERLFQKVRALSLYGGIDNQTGIAGTWAFLELANKVTSSVSGSIAELGVYKGGNAFISLLLGKDTLQERPYHLFDSFAGFPSVSRFDPSARANEFADVSVEVVGSTFAHFPNTALHVGMFEDTLSSVADETFALVYIDCDLYEPALDCCEFFYPRIRPGGLLLLHDYCEPGRDLPKGCTPPFLGIHKAVHQFFEGKPDRIVPIPESMHVAIIKS